METFEFLGWNVIIVGVVFLVVLVYLILLIQKRQREKFLHQDRRKES